MGQELSLYDRRLDRTVDDLEGIQTVTAALGGILGTASLGISAYGYFTDTSDEASSFLTKVNYGLSAVGVLSPLKTPVSLLQKGLKRVDEALEKTGDKAREIDRKDDASTPGQDEDGEFLDRVQRNIDATTFEIGIARDTLTLRIRELEIASDAMDGFRVTLAAATAEDAEWGDRYVDLETAVEAQLGARNPAVAEVRRQATAVEERLAEFRTTLNNIDFERILNGVVDLEALAEAVEALQRPLDLADVALDPIRPLLDAIDTLARLIVDPVVDYVLETIGLKDEIEQVERLLADLAPPLDMLDALSRLLQQVQDDLLEYAVDWLGTRTLLDGIGPAFFEGGVGDAEAGVTGWGNGVGNVLEGDDGADILNALGGDDVIRGGAGDDVILAGRGSDTIHGEAGDDLIYFDASFSEYELARDPDSGAIIVNHMRVGDGAGTGVDVLEALDAEDRVVFNDTSFSGAQLNDAVIGGSVLTGDRGGVVRDDLIFLNSSGQTRNGFHVAEGRRGHDVIFGSTEDDRLVGGRGNDVLFPGSGDDRAEGDGGSDTFQVLGGVRTELRVDLEAGTAFGQGRDTLTSIENVILSADRDHFVAGDGAANLIHTGDGIDVIAGRGGNDRIVSGGEDDYVIAGRGSDTVLLGDGRDVVVSGSAARRGVSDTYDGRGAGRDVLAYTSSANTILFDIQDESDDPAIGQQFRRSMEEVPESGPVEIRAGEGRVIRFDRDGERVAEDEAIEIEGFVGSDLADRLFGSPETRSLHGAGGADTIRTGGTGSIDGGGGNDLIVVEAVQGGATRVAVDGGGGFDRINLDAIGDARWFYRIESAIALTLRAHSIDVEGEDLRNAGSVFFDIRPRDVEQITLGERADHVIYEPGGTVSALFYLRDGDDRFDAENGFADVRAGHGDDLGRFDGGGGGIFRGEQGDDRAVFNDTGRDNAALMGSGDDHLVIERFFGRANGSTGYDVVAFDVGLSSRLVVDLAEGAAQSFKNDPRNLAEQVGMTLTGFEELIASEFDDAVTGSAGDERLVARGGRDTVEGGGGNDQIFGGTGDDRLDGGAGDDLLHGGAGADDLRGGAGRDTASYAWARPEGLDGAPGVDVFRGVAVDLSTGTATGAFGTDRLSGIENVAGSGGADRLTGDARANLLSGGAGGDTLQGGAGGDVIVAGAGDDLLFGGAGDDRLVAGLGQEAIDGGSGRDTLDLGAVGGSVDVSVEDGRYDVASARTEARWLRRDLDGDGRDESDGTEARVFDGVALRPSDVLETDPLHANDAGDLSRRLPEIGDVAFETFLIETVEAPSRATGTFSGIEVYAAGAGDDRLEGGRGADRLEGGAGTDRLTGGRGADDLDGGSGADRVGGGDGDDRLHGGDGRDTVLGSTGDDTVVAGRGAERLDGGTGTDMLSYAASGEGVRLDLQFGTVSGGWAGNDTVSRFEGVTGSDGGADLLEGNAAANHMRGLAGADTLSGRAGRDFLEGGQGDDRLSGGGGGDRVWGGAGADRVDGGAGDDRLTGGRGRDVVTGGDGDDMLRAGGGAERFDGGAGRDMLSYHGSGDGVRVNLSTNAVSGGWAGNDTLSGIEDLGGSARGGDSLTGDGGANVLRGFGGADLLAGGGGADVLRGATGDDRLWGGRGADRLLGGTGDDSLTGGTGADRFEFARGGGSDRITDFRDDVDTIVLSDLGVSTRVDAMAAARQEGRDVVFRFSTGDRLTVEDARLDMLQDDLLLA